MAINHITEKKLGEMINSEIRDNPRYIINPDMFSQHLIDTGRISRGIASQILRRYTFSGNNKIDPNALATAGYLHDWTKIYEGDEYHEIGTAHKIITDGEKLGLVKNGSEKKIRETLKQIAAIIPPLYGVYEELGGKSYLEGALYPSVNNFKERVEFLRRELSTNPDIPLSIEELALPHTIPQYVGLYADMTNNNGQRVDVIKRLDDIVERYSTTPGLNPKTVEITKTIRPRILGICWFVEGLLR